MLKILSVVERLKTLSKVEEKKLILLAVCLVGLPCTLATVLGANAPADAEKRKQDSLRAVRAEKIAAFRAIYPDVKVRTNPKTGVPENLWGDLSKNQTQTNPVETTYEFYEQNKELYSITDPRSELRVERVEETELGPLVVLKQYYKDVEIYNSKVKVNFSRSGKLNGINGGCAQVGELPTTPAIDSSAAIQIVKSDLSFPVGYNYNQLEVERVGRYSNRRPSPARLVVYSHRSIYRLVWIVRLFGYKTDSDWEYFIDAQSGDIFDKQDLIIPTLPGPKPERKTSPVPRQNLEEPDTTLKQAPRQESSSPVESSPIPTESWGWVPPSELDSLRSFWKIEPNTSVKPNPSMKTPSSIPLDTSRNPPQGIQRIEPIYIQLEEHIDSIISRLKKQEKPREKKKSPDDSLRRSLRSIPSSFVSIMEEQFIFGFPEESPNWNTFDKNLDTGGVYFWDDENYDPSTGGFRGVGWCAGGGLNGQLLDPRFDNYPLRMHSWMVYGPFSLSDATDAELWFWNWMNTGNAQGFDFFSYLKSSNGVNWSGFTNCCNSDGWVLTNFDLSNLIGQSGLYVAFRFTSNPIQPANAKGVFLDDIVLFKNVPGGQRPDLAHYQPAEWENPIVVSCCRGTNRQSQPILNEQAYIDFAMANISPTDGSTRTISRLLVDGQEIWRRTFEPPFNAGSSFSVQDTPYVFTTAGLHTVRLEVDYLDAEIEDNVSNNNFNYQFVVLGTGDNAGTGTGVLGNNKSHIDTRCNGFTFFLRDFTRQLNNDPHGHRGGMVSSEYIETERWENGTEIAMTDADNVWNNSNQASSVDAHVYVGWIYDYLLLLSGGSALDSITKLGMSNLVDDNRFGTDNAAYRAPGELVVYAASDTMYSFAAAVDVLGHEYGHRIIDFTSQLNIRREPGALYESVSDIFGICVGFATDDPDWELGDKIFKTRIDKLRDLANPDSKGDPDTYRRPPNWFWVNQDSCQNPDWTNDYCGRHTNCGVPNKMFYLFAELGPKTFNYVTVTGIGTDNAMKVMYLASRNKWIDTTNFLMARIGSVQVADSLDPAWAAELKNAWDAVRVCMKADENGDGNLTPADAVLLLNCIFLATPPCNLCSADLNCVGGIAPADAVIALRVVFLGEPDGCPLP